jgi:membrane protease YdiL (CAAX protease family)
MNSVTVAAAWLAYVIGLIAGGALNDPASLAIGATAGAVLVIVGYAAASRTRTISNSPNRFRLGAAALAAGAGLGLANLAANWLIASAHPALRYLLVQRMTTLDPIVAVVAAPLGEEVTFRLFLMSALAWMVSRFTSNRSVVFVAALLGSSVVFALMHLGRAAPPDPELALFYRASLVAKYTLAGLPLGWIFWRWGLPYAVVCHAASNAAHLIAQRFVF